MAQALDLTDKRSNSSNGPMGSVACPAAGFTAKPMRFFLVVTVCASCLSFVVLPKDSSEDETNAPGGVNEGGADVACDPLFTSVGEPVGRSDKPPRMIDLPFFPAQYNGGRRPAESVTKATSGGVPFNSP